MVEEKELITHTEITTKHVATWGKARVINRHATEGVVFRFLHLDTPDRFCIERWENGDEYRSDVFGDIHHAHNEWVKVSVLGRK